MHLKPHKGNLKGAAHQAAPAPRHINWSLICLCALGLTMIAFAASASWLLIHTKSKAAEIEPWPEAAEEVFDDGFPKVDWGYWQAVNPAVIGWVTVPGTSIDYPIVQAPAEDPDYYLTHDVFCEENFYGCPYLDAECASEGFESRVSYIFGHHLQDGSMFSEFANYSDQSFAEEHQDILLQTPHEKRRLKIIAADVINAHDQMKKTEFADDGEFRSWVSELLNESDMKLAETAQGAATTEAASAQQARLTIFVTCSYNLFSNERTLCIAL